MQLHLAMLLANLCGRPAPVLMLAAALMAGVCQTIEPANMQRDRMDYGGVIADSWKAQTFKET